VLDNCSVSTLLDGVTTVAHDYGATVQFSQGCDQESNDTSQIAAAVSLAQGSDIVIAFLGLRNCEGGQGKGGPNCESEGHDRDELGLPGVQGELLEKLHATGKNVVLVLTNGGPIACPWAAQNIPAIVDAWYGGMDGGLGVANVLFGVGGASPAGRLPFMVPQSVAQLPDELDMALAAPPFGRTYRHFNATPLFNFGFGLSYADFTYTGLSLTPTTVSAASPVNVTACVTVANTGKLPSEEVVQMYASRSAVGNAGLQSVPNVQLVAFTRTVVVQPGASIHVCLELDVHRVSLLGPDGKFGPQPGSYAISAGGSCPGSLGAYVDRAALQEPITEALVIRH
jgi:beta-glucosidase